MSSSFLGISPYAALSRDFSVQAADSHSMLDAAYRLRYRVYCVENQFQDPTLAIDQKEIDRYDDHAFHTVLVHRKSGRVVGCARLIMPNAGGLPFDRICAPGQRPPEALLPRARTAELSRLSISRTILTELADIDPALQSYLLPALLGGLAALSDFHGITHWCFALEPRLITRLNKISIYVQSFGTPVEYHGIRQTAYLNLQTANDRVRAERQDIWSPFTQDGRYDREVAA